MRAAKIDMLGDAPTPHDADVVERLRWQAHDAAPQLRVDEAFDVEAITQKFFLGLRRHFNRLESALALDGQHRPSVLAGREQAGGARRVAIRIVSQLLLCWFLQRKGLLAGDPNYLRTRWRQRSGSYYGTELEPLFYETLAVPVAKRQRQRPQSEVPFLNGGLFYRGYGAVSLDIPDALLGEDDGLIGYLGRWTFTLSEESRDTADVAVDPELLGRIFENLISDDEQSKHGVVYTPRPVVQFMCREALIAHLAAALPLDSTWARRLVVQEDGLAAFARAEGSRAALDLAARLDHELEALTVIDPAVGSGAFLLGALTEIVQLRHQVHAVAKGHAAPAAVVHAWKLHCIEHTLFGVDIEPLALELCRLRLWLSLIVEVDGSGRVPPLPNLEYRTVAGDSLTDYVASARVQDTHGGARAAVGHRLFLQVKAVEPLRHEYFSTSDPDRKAGLRVQLAAEEDRLVSELLEGAAGHEPAATADARAALKRYVGGLQAAFGSRDRVYPNFMPAFHAPDVWERGGWDIVLMNPPYLGKKQVAEKVRQQQIPGEKARDWELHHAEKNDLMVLFGYRVRELVKPGGVCAVIFQDSVFTSTDALRLRRLWWSEDTVQVVARTRCFEGQAVNGAVVVWRAAASDSGQRLRWIEGYKRDPRDFAAASDPLSGDAARGRAGSMEVWDVDAQAYHQIPARPLFRPSPVALSLVKTFDAAEPPAVRQETAWDELSNTSRLNASIHLLQQAGWFAQRRPGDVVPLGYCISGGQGLATADDPLFLAARGGTALAASVATACARLVTQLEQDPRARTAWQRARQRTDTVEEALVLLHEEDEHLPGVKWPRLLRVAPPALVRVEALSPEEVRLGIAAGPSFVPFEKGDASAADEGGQALGARWWRDNPVLIDWSAARVATLRQRAASPDRHRKPYFRNEALWGQGGVTWNSVGRYLRARLVPETGLFGHMAPTIRPQVDWLDTPGLLALMNADVLEFLVRTFLGSLMHFEIGDIRRVPLPVPSSAEAHALSQLGTAAVEATKADDRPQLAEIECQVNRLGRRLYGVPEEAELWVVR